MTRQKIDLHYGELFNTMCTENEKVTKWLYQFSFLSYLSSFFFLSFFHSFILYSSSNVQTCLNVLQEHSYHWFHHSICYNSRPNLHCDGPSTIASLLCTQLQLRVSIFFPCDGILKWGLTQSRLWTLLGSSISKCHPTAQYLDEDQWENSFFLSLSLFNSKLSCTYR